MEERLVIGDKRSVKFGKQGTKAPPDWGELTRHPQPSRGIPGKLPLSFYNGIPRLSLGMTAR